MSISEKEAQRLNVSMPVANDVKLGDVIKSLQENTETATSISDIDGLQSVLDGIQEEIDDLKGAGED